MLKFCNGGHNFQLFSFSAFQQWTCQLAWDFFNPIVTGTRVGAEGFEVSFPIVVKEGAVEAERAGIRRVDQAGGVARAHLEEHTHFEFAQSLSTKESGHVVVGVTGNYEVKAV